MLNRILLVAVIFFGPEHSVVKAFAAPSTYEDCILENMKGVVAESAARLIAEACRAKFPPPGHAPPCLNGQTVCKPWERDWAKGDGIPIGTIVTNSGELVFPPAPLPPGFFLDHACTELSDNVFDKFGGPYEFERAKPSRWVCPP